MKGVGLPNRSNYEQFVWQKTIYIAAMVNAGSLLCMSSYIATPKKFMISLISVSPTLLLPDYWTVVSIYSKGKPLGGLITLAAFNYA